MACRGKASDALHWLHRRTIFAFCFALLFSLEGVSSHALADELEKPREDIILTVTGNIAHHNADGAVLLDRPMIENVGLKELETHTVFSSKAYLWHGPLMRDLLEYIGARGESIEVLALDGYSITIPIKDFYDYDVLLATKRDGKHLSVRNRGPIRLIYPIDHDQTLRDPKYTSRFVWQIEKIVVK